jgi:beta-ureidopropionase / N-carbamoyl-L-amino-acid hydrolase
MTLTLKLLNAVPHEQALALLAGVYEHSPWVSDAALRARPFASLAHLQLAMSQAVRQAPRETQLALIRAHPALATRAGIAGLTAESAGEQSRARLTHCSEAEFAQLQALNANYHARFGWPFILAVRGPRGTGLSRQQIISTFERRLQHPSDFEFAECLRNIDRIAQLRLNEKFGFEPTLGNAVWDWCEALAVHSDPGFKEAGQLTVTYLTEAHLACQRQIAASMRDCGFDDVQIDAVGNVVGRYASSAENARTLYTGSHFDTVRNGGRFDGRLGIFVPMACVRELARQGRRLPFHFEVIAFAEEEGQRYKAAFLGSGALTGQFDAAWLEQQDKDGVSMRDAMLGAGLPATIEAIAALRRDPAGALGFVEVHIEQGPVLNESNLPLGVVTSINGSLRYQGAVVGMASHAGTTPMNRRRDAAAAVAELLLYVEDRATQDADSVGTVGMLEVPSGSINVVPGRCRFSLDLRAPDDAQRDALGEHVLARLDAICKRRGLSYELEQTMRAAAAPSDAAWQARWAGAVQSLGLPVFEMASGAGHDAMKMHEIMPQAMLFVRGENSGISHNPLESTTSDDIDLAVRAMLHLLENL